MTANLSVARDAGGMERFYTDLHAAMYDMGQVDGTPAPTAREFAAFLAAEYPDGMRGLTCLDAGCGGTGINSRSLVAAGADRVCAVDLNRGSLQLLRRSLAQGRDGRLSMACASLLDLPLASSTFDFTVCSGVVHHTPDPELALRELRRTLKADGRLYVSVYCFDGSVMYLAVKLWRLAARVVPFRLMHALFRRSAVVNNFVLDHMYVPVLWVYRERDFARLLDGAGFVIERSFVSAFDYMNRWKLGPLSMSGDGLLRIFVCRPRPAGAQG